MVRVYRTYANKECQSSHVIRVHVPLRCEYRCVLRMSHKENRRLTVIVSDDIQSSSNPGLGAGQCSGLIEPSRVVHTNGTRNSRTQHTYGTYSNAALCRCVETRPLTSSAFALIFKQFFLCDYVRNNSLAHEYRICVSLCTGTYTGVNGWKCVFLCV